MLSPEQKALHRFRVKNAYTAQGALHKMIGQIVSRTMGMTDAPQEFFDEVENQFYKSLGEAGLDMDLKDPDVYPHLRRSINQVVSEQ
jgi:hypothetical protein